MKRPQLEQVGEHLLWSGVFSSIMGYLPYVLARRLRGVSALRSPRDHCDMRTSILLVSLFLMNNLVTKRCSSAYPQVQGRIKLPRQESNLQPSP